MAKGLIFTLPPGVDIPDGTMEGDTFQAMATFKLLSATAYGTQMSDVKPGQVQLEEVDGEPIGSALPRNLAAPDRSNVMQPSPSNSISSMMAPGGS